jgi:hypothetical protein
MAATGSVPARARRHPMTVVTRARQLVAAGWTAEGAARLLAREGVTVDARSVRRWTDRRVQAAMELAEHDRTARKARQAGAGPMGPRHATPEYKLARMRALRERAGLKDAQIARVMTFDFGDVLSREMVRDALEHGRYPRSLR